MEALLERVGWSWCCWLRAHPRTRRLLLVVFAVCYVGTGAALGHVLARAILAALP